MIDCRDSPVDRKGYLDFYESNKDKDRRQKMNDQPRHEPPQALVSKTTESMIWFTTLPMLLHVVRFASSVLLARLLEPRDFGIVGIASILVYYTNNLSHFGLGNAIVQRKDINDDHLNTFFTMNLSISFLLFMGFIAAAPWMADFFEMQELTAVITVFSSIFLMTSFYTIAYTKLRRELGFRAIALNEAIKVLVSMPVSLLLAAYGFGYWALIVAMLSSTLVATVSLCLRAKISYRLRYTNKAFMELLNYASWNFFSLQVRLLSEYIDKLLIGKISGAAILGYYEKSFGIAQMPHEQMANKLGAIAFSTFSRSQTDPHELRHYFLRMLTILTFLALPIFVGLLAISEPFVLALLGAKWAPMIPSFQILLVAFLVSSISSLFSTLNVTCGFYKKDILLRLASLVGLIGILPLAVRHGLAAVAFAVLVHNLLYLLFAVGLSRRIVSYSWQDLFTSLFPAVAGACLVFLAVRAAEAWLAGPGSFFNLALLALTGVATYVLWFLGTRFRAWQFIRIKLFRQLDTILDRGKDS